MIKRPSATPGPSARQTKAAAVPTPQHQHTSNIALLGVGESEDRSPSQNGGNVGSL